MKLKCWRDSRLVRRRSADRGICVFALAFIEKGEILAIKSGHIVDEGFIKSNTNLVKGSHMQITDRLFLAPTTEEEWDNTLIGFNHSCEPNAYIEGHVVMKSMRDIEKGEEITTDYAITYTSDTQEFDCNCKSDNCRGHIKPSTDWKSNELQQKYKGYFADFIQEKINKTKDENETS